MFIKVYITLNHFILVNTAHIVYISPSSVNRGCSLILATGITLNSVDDYDVLLSQINPN